MADIILTCEEMNPQVIPIWKMTWDRLKRKHRGMKVNVFVVPYYKEIPDNDVFRNKDFDIWYQERKKWVEIAQMGYCFSSPSECTRLGKPQYRMIRKGYRKLVSYMPKDIRCFRSPEDRIGPNTPSILQSLGFTAYLYHKSFVMLAKMEREIDECQIIRTHISIDKKHPDDIQAFYQKLDKKLMQARKEGIKSITISNFLKRSMGDVK